MATINPDPVKNLSDLALFIAHHVRQALSASFVTTLADLWIERFSAEEKRKLFRTHPANNIIYSGLRALEEQSIVHIYETLKDPNKLFPITAEIRRKQDLRLHRHAISHPGTIEWTDKKMQAFADADRDGYDWRPAQVWDLQRSINEDLRKNGEETYNESIEVTYDMAVALHTILSLSFMPPLPAPSPDDLFVKMQAEVVKYQAQLEKNPDGRDLEREKLAAERHRRRQARWANKTDNNKPSA